MGLIDVVETKLQTVDGIGIYFERAQSKLDLFWSKRKKDKVFSFDEDQQERDGWGRTQSDHELLVPEPRETDHAGKGKNFHRTYGGEKNISTNSLITTRIKMKMAQQ